MKNALWRNSHWLIGTWVFIRSKEVSDTWNGLRTPNTSIFLVILVRQSRFSSLNPLLFDYFCSFTLDYPLNTRIALAYGRPVQLFIFHHFRAPITPTFRAHWTKWMHLIAPLQFHLPLCRHLPAFYSCFLSNQPSCRRF